MIVLNIGTLQFSVALKGAVKVMLSSTWKGLAKVVVFTLSSENPNGHFAT